MAERSRARPSELKLEIALEALAGRDTVKAIAARHGVHPNLVHRWKKRMVDAAVASFAAGQPAVAPSDRERELREELARLKAERDFLARKLARSRRASGDEW